MDEMIGKVLCVGCVMALFFCLLSLVDWIIFLVVQKCQAMLPKYLLS